MRHPFFILSQEMYIRKPQLGEAPSIRSKCAWLSCGVLIISSLILSENFSGIKEQALNAFSNFSIDKVLNQNKTRSAAQQVHLCLCPSVCPSVVKPEFLPVWSAYDNL